MTKTFKQVKRKIRKLSKEENSSQNNLIIQKRNMFIVYDMYKIIKDKHNFKIYIISGDEYVGTVFNSSSAISWCNAHRGNNTSLAYNIISTDRAIEFLDNDIAYTKILIKLKSTPHNEQSILLARLTEYINKHLHIKLKLHKYIQRSKQIKSKGFLNEFTAPNTTKEFNRVR